MPYIVVVTIQTTQCWSNNTETINPGLHIGSQCPELVYGFLKEIFAKTETPTNEKVEEILGTGCSGNFCVGKEFEVHVEYTSTKDSGDGQVGTMA